MECNYTNDVIKLHKDKNWREIVDKYHDYSDRNKLLWVFPSEDNLKFLMDSVLRFGCEDILSIGCGSGLLEWIVQEATGIKVSGLEVNGVWWRCKYAPPTFIPLLFTPPELDEKTIELLQNAQNTALLFCYFNNREAFDNYLKYYKGKLLVVIGPDGKNVHTDPKPFDNIGSNWTLYGHQEVRNSKDFIAIYVKV